MRLELILQGVNVIPTSHKNQNSTRPFFPDYVAKQMLNEVETNGIRIPTGERLSSPRTVLPKISSFKYLLLKKGQKKLKYNWGIATKTKTNFIYLNCRSNLALPLFETWSLFLHFPCLFLTIIINLIVFIQLIPSHFQNILQKMCSDWICKTLKTEQSPTPK